MQIFQNLINLSEHLLFNAFPFVWPRISLRNISKSNLCQFDRLFYVKGLVRFNEACGEIFKLYWTTHFKCISYHLTRSFLKIKILLCDCSRMI